MRTNPIPRPERSGILSGGNWILDRVKVIDRYPERERLANILSESLHNGGAAYNLLTDLSKLGAPFPLAGAGLVGEDAEGEHILAHCRSLSIDTAAMRRVPGVSTSYTDVFTERDSGRRTFFHSRGANALLDPADFPLDTSSARILHLGYLLLLDRLDALHEDGKPRAFHLLRKARSLGFRTAVDVVSEEGDRFPNVILPVLPAVDILLLNEYEAGKITGLDLTEADGSIRMEACRAALGMLIEKGVQEWAVLHFPQGALAMSSRDDYVFQPSVRVPPSLIAGTVGAGDAFAAGVLYGEHEGAPMEECLRYGVCAAAACLLHLSSSEGVLDLQGCLELGARYGFQDRLGFDPNQGGR
ncbi:MAG: carbohydrate kinase family protein [Fibrobacterota bacterium]|nr:carbohydrate kinase family protein [Fibrobacterota bacterium]